MINFRRSSWAVRSITRAFQQRKRKQIQSVQAVEVLEDRTLLSANFSPLDLPDSVTEQLPKYHPSQILVQFEDSSDIGATMHSAMAGAQIGEGFSLVPGLHVITLPEGANVETAVAAFQNNPNVVFAEPDYILQSENHVLPNDDAWWSTDDSLWALSNVGQEGGTVDADIDALQAWSVTTGDSSVIVAEIGSGVEIDHPDLAANIWVNTGEIPDDGIDNDGNGFIDDINGWDFGDNDNDPRNSSHLHATYTAGILGSVGNNNEGITGVAWNSKIMPLKIRVTDGGLLTSAAVAALDYAVANGAMISNNSYGGGSFSQAHLTAIENARDAGHIFVASAGNAGIDSDATEHYPSTYDVDNIISVAASDRNDELASFSNFGATTVDLAAPGVRVDLITGVRASGTSLAAPHVAGVAALVKSIHPEFTYDQVISQILSSVDPIPDFTGKMVSGGRLNAARAVGADLSLEAEIYLTTGSVVEGDSGTTEMEFTVHRVMDTSGTVTVGYVTSDETATVADGDYIATSGEVTFAPGEIEKTFSVTVNGDTLEEDFEQFRVTLSIVNGNASVVNHDRGLILHDDADVSISDVTIVEGDETPRFLDRFVPSSEGGVDHPREVLFGPDGNFYVANESDKILRYDGISGAYLDDYVTTTFAISRSIVFDASGNLFVTTPSTDSILRYDPSGNPFPSAGNSGAVFGNVIGVDLWGLSLDSSGDLYVVERPTGEVFRFDGTTGDAKPAPGQTGATFVAAFISESDWTPSIAFGPDGNLYLVRTGTGEVLRFDGIDGTFIDAFVAAGSGGMIGPYDLEFSQQDGLLYVSDKNLNQVLRYDDTTGRFIDVFAQASLIDRPKGITIDSDGIVYLANSGNDEILRFDDQAHAVLTVDFSRDVATANIDFSTSSGSAIGGADFTSTSGTRSASQTREPWLQEFRIIVPVLTGSEIEGNESFTVDLTGSASGLNIVDGQGEVTIIDTTTSSFAGSSVAIKDRKGGNPGKTTTSITVSESGTIYDANVLLDISHGRLSDLDVFLIAPDGTRIELFSNVTSMGTDITVDDESTVSIFNGLASGGSFRPLGNLRNADGMDINGEWTLEFTDSMMGESGTLNSWSLEFRHTIPAPPLPSVSIDDVSVNEGDAGTTEAVFTVALSEVAAEDVTVNFTTQDDTATAGSDYLAASGSVVIPAGSSSTTVSITVNGDTDDESNETFFVNLSNVSANAIIADGQGVGTIIDDDGVGLSVDGVSPDSAAPNQQLTVTVTGTGFVDGVTVDFGNKVNVQGITFINSGQLDVQIKVHKRASTGSRDVTVTNPDNSSDTLVGGFTVTANLFAETTGDGNGIIPLSQADAEAFAEFALQLWIGAEGITEVPNFDIIVADLPGNQLGMFDDNVITLDIDAAGVGWFIDATPFDNSEFAFGVDGYDLLTAAAHEVGHALGFNHEHDGVMAETLAIGERHLPSEEYHREALLIPMFESNTQDDSTSDDSLGTGIITSPQPLAEKSSYALENDFDTSLTDDDFDSSEPVPYLPEEDLDPDSFFSEFEDSLLDDLLAIA